MNFDLAQDDTDAALADAAERFLRERFDLAERLRRPAAERRFDAAAWRSMAELGWLGVAVPEAHGGFGLRVGSVALLARAAGRALVNEPLLSAAVAADAIARHAAPSQQAGWLPALADGSSRAVPVFALGVGESRDGALHGRVDVAPDADVADRLLVQASSDGVPRWFAIDAGAPGLQRAALPLVDGRGAATLVFDGCRAEPLPGGSSDHPALLGALGAAADAVGAMDAAFDATLEYLKTRKQFGVPIGTFQALQHRCVDMYLRLVEGRAVLARAAQALAADPDGAARDVHAAKAFVGEHAILLAQEAVQMHGGVGITEEFAVSHLLRRVRVDAQWFGDAAQHLARFAALPETN